MHKHKHTHRDLHKSELKQIVVFLKDMPGSLVLKFKNHLFATMFVLRNGHFATDYRMVITHKTNIKNNELE